MRVIPAGVCGRCVTDEKSHRSYRRGDTIIEVIFAITVFSFVSILTLNLMNSGINVTQANLQLTTTSTEMSAQSTALRFVHNGFTAEYQYPELAHYVPVWEAIVERAIDAGSLMDIREVSHCDAIYNDPTFISTQRPFVINTRRLNTNAALLTDERINGAVVIPTSSPSMPPVPSSTAVPSTAPFISPPVSSRVVFGNPLDNSDTELKESIDYQDVVRVEGLWVTAVKGDVHSETIHNYDTGTTETVHIPRYYDLYIRTCWFGAGRNYPTKLQSILRLYNPTSDVGSELDEASAI